MQQLTLDISLHDGFRFESFYTNRDNSDVVRLLKKIAQEEEQGQFFLWGEKHTGKSHLLQACCLKASLSGNIVSYLPLKSLSQHGTRSLQGLKYASMVVIDDIDSVLGQPKWEEALFHLINEIRQYEQTLIITARKEPHQLDCQLADLKSRLLWGASYQVHELSDQDKFLALQSRARQRGFEIPKNVINYLAKHYPHELDTLMDILNSIDKKSLITGRKITLPLIKEALKE